MNNGFSYALFGVVGILCAMLPAAFATCLLSFCQSQTYGFPPVAPNLFPFCLQTISNV